MANHSVLSGARVLRLASLLSALTMLLLVAACGGSGSSSTAPVSGLKNRAFISNTYSGNLQIVDTQNDTTAFTQETTNSAGQVVPGTPVTITVSSSVTFEVEGPSNTLTAVYDPGTLGLYFVTNSAETVAGNATLTSGTSMALFSPGGTTVYTPEPNLPVAGSRSGGIEVFSSSTFDLTTSYDVPSVRYIALSPSGQYLLAFASNSDSLWLINLTASTVTPVEIPGFARPINAFFSTDSNTAYVLNCGPECGSSGKASVAFFDIPSQTITGTVPVGGASVGLLNGTTLYVAGSPVPTGTTSTFDAVNVSNMTRLTAASVQIGDGFHTTMAFTGSNNKLYIGAITCSNTVTGCLSVVNVSTNTFDAALPPRGVITSLLAIPNRNVVYAIEGGLLAIYNTDTDTVMTPSTLIFSGALYGIVQVDQ
jgi:hypothetical protein